MPDCLGGCLGNHQLNNFICIGIRWSLFSYLHNNSQSLIIIFAHYHNSQNTDHMIQIACYVIILVLRVFLSFRDFLSILELLCLCLSWLLSLTISSTVWIMFYFKHFLRINSCPEQDLNLGQQRTYCYLNLHQCLRPLNHFIWIHQLNYGFSQIPTKALESHPKHFSSSFPNVLTALYTQIV